MTTPSSTVRLEVREHRARVNTRCALCGDPCRPTGRDAFLAGTWSMVCASCSIAHALDVRASAHQKRVGDDLASPRGETGESCAWNREHCSNVQIPPARRAA